MTTPTFDAPQSPIEAILQNMLGANNQLREPQSRNEALLLQILAAMQQGGGDVTAAAVLAAMIDMTDEQAAAALYAIGGAPLSNALTEAVKQALLQCFKDVSWLDDQAAESDMAALYDALYPVQSIAAVYTQTETVYTGTSLDSLKSDLVVTATYEDGSTATLADADYTLSGTLTVGISTITATYKGKTATFEVTVSESTVTYGYDLVGEPTISNGIMTPTATGWIKSKIEFLPDDKPWKIIFKIKNTSNSGYNNYVSASGILIQRVSAQANAMLYLTASTTGDISCNKQRAFTLNSWIWCKLEFTGIAYLYGVSSDGETYDNVTINSSTTIKQASALIFGSKASNTAAVSADFDLSSMEAWIDGSLVWKAVEEA